MSSVENQAAGQLVASLDSVHAVRYSSSHCNCQLLAMELWTNPHSSTLMKEMYPDMSDMTSIVQIPSCKGFSWEKWLMNRWNKTLLTQSWRCWYQKKQNQRSLWSWETKRSLVAKTKLNFKRNKLDNIADKICGEPDTTSIGDVGSCKNKRRLRSWGTKRILGVAKTKFNFQRNWRAVQTTQIEQRWKSPVCVNHASRRTTCRFCKPEKETHQIGCPHRTTCVGLKERDSHPGPCFEWTGANAYFNFGVHNIDSICLEEQTCLFWLLR